MLNEEVYVNGQIGLNIKLAFNLENCHSNQSASDELANNRNSSQP